MPPPRLSRHLRPCHLPVTAKQVRCVRTTGHAKLSTTGFDTPQTPSAKGSTGEGSALSDPTDSKNDVPAEEKSWWKEALGRIASFGSHGDQFESKSGRSPFHVEQPERPAINLQETREEPQRNETGFTQASAGLTTSQQVGETQQEQMRFADCGNEGSASSGQVDMAVLQQQIKQLSEQLRALEARVEGRSSKEQSSSTSAAALRTLTMRPDATQFNMDNQELSYLPHTPPRIAQNIIPLSADVLRTLQRAQSVYTRSVSLYGTAAGVFAKLPAHIVAPVAPSILRHFRSIRGIAMLEDDIKTSDIYVKFRPTINLLESILRRSSVPAPSLNDPVVAYEIAKYSKTLSYDNFISHTLDACWKRYRLSSRRLGDIATELRSIRSPMVAPIASRVREQLLTIGAHANEEGDRILINYLGPDYKTESAPLKKRRSSQIKPPASVSISTNTREEDMQNVTAENGEDRERLVHRIHAQSRSMKSSIDLRMNSKDRGLETGAAEQRSQIKESIPSSPRSNAEASTAARATISSKSPLRTDEVSEQSLLEELFPETNSIPQPQPTRETRDQYPRLKLPQSPVRPVFSDRLRRPAKQAAESIQKHGEQITVLQLTNCSTGLTEADFRRIIPKGKHLEGWRRDSDFYKIIPGRDPLSLERLPFYYLLFKTTEAALSYQKNVSRLHKLSARYQPSSILSAIPPPKGFLEDGEDIAAAVGSYNLLPKNHTLSLNVLMQPYNPALRQLIERGGYQPIVTSDEDKGKKICKVLLHMEGWEPSPSDLFAAITRDAYRQGMLHPLRNESQSSIHRLRDMINLNVSIKAVSSSRPRAYGTFDHSASPNANSNSASEPMYDDPEIQSIMGRAEEDRPQAQMNQEVMNRVYNRWVLDFEDLDTARRWSLRWHRRALLDVASGESTWKDAEEARICNTEVLW